MNPIVLATDFSPSASRAAQVAARLAHAGQTELILLNAYQFWPVNPAKTGDFPLSSRAMYDESQRELHHLASDLRRQIDPDLRLRCLTREGHTRTVIADVTATEGAALLVMATTGTAPQSSRLMGSVATDMVADTNVPLLLIPPGAPLTIPKNAVLAVNLAAPPNALALETALRFARQCQSVVNVVCVDGHRRSEATRHRAEQLRTLLVNQPHTLTLLADEADSGQPLFSTLLQAAREQKADLLMMLPQPHNWLENLLFEGETQRMARLTDMPLLAIR